MHTIIKPAARPTKIKFAICLFAAATVFLTYVQTAQGATRGDLLHYVLEEGGKSAASRLYVPQNKMDAPVNLAEALKLSFDAFNVKYKIGKNIWFKDILKKATERKIIP